jgi:hypothetical protein
MRRRALSRQSNPLSVAALTSIVTAQLLPKPREARKSTFP